jgi:hypothetical protein
MTRLWVVGITLKMVATSSDEPARFVWEGRLHVVEGIANSWRVDLGWWRLHIWRDYYKLYTTTGLLLVVYHDLVSGQWYLQRVYD